MTIHHPKNEGKKDKPLNPNPLPMRDTEREKDPNPITATPGNRHIRREGKNHPTRTKAERLFGNNMITLRAANVALTPPPRSRRYKKVANLMANNASKDKTFTHAHDRAANHALHTVCSYPPPSAGSIRSR